MNHKQSKSFNLGIGATKDLSLRVSVATLVRVLVENHKDGEWILALERKATLFNREEGPYVDVKAQPFGGALRILDTMTLQQSIGDFHFDSQESRSEEDFRIFIRPSAWKAVREFCLEHLKKTDHTFLESDPTRELNEEFSSALGINLQPSQYVLKPIGTIIEDAPSSTENLYARSYPTVRIYLVFEARILDLSLAFAMRTNSEKYSDQDLRQLAFEDSQNGGPGWYNAALTLPLSELTTAYLSIVPEARNRPISFQNYQLDETVAAVLEGVTVPKYRRL